MLLSMIRDGNFLQNLPIILLMIPGLLFSLSVHETLHGYTAYKLGDPTARNLGRLTLNPMKHIDPLGFLLLMVAGFGWAKPVPVNSRYFKKPKRDIMLTSLAGPLSNLVLSFIFTGLLVATDIIAFTVFDTSPSWDIFATEIIGLRIVNLCFVFFVYMATINISLCVFNLIPCPPLDGSKILYGILPQSIGYKLVKYENVLHFLLLGLLIFGAFSNFISTVSDFIFSGFVNFYYMIIDLFI